MFATGEFVKTSESEVRQMRHIVFEKLTDDGQSGKGHCPAGRNGGGQYGRDGRAKA